RRAEGDRLGAVPVAREAERDQRVIVRPDRAVVVRSGVEAPLALAQGADAPAAEEVGAEQALRHARRALGAHHAGKQQLAGVRAAHAARRAVAVERDRIGAELLAPERGLEARRELVGFLLELGGKLLLAEVEREQRGLAPGEEAVALHLAQRD